MASSQPCLGPQWSWLQFAQTNLGLVVIVITVLLEFIATPMLICFLIDHSCRF